MQAPTLTNRLMSLARRPSALYAAAVQKGHLLPDPIQQQALPPLDKLVCNLPPYQASMDSHAASLAIWESSYKRAVSRENRRSSGTLGRAWTSFRTASGLIPDTPPALRPPRYYGLPERPVAPTPPRGAYMFGEVGSGKSLLMDMVFTCAEAQVESAIRVHYHTFMISTYELMHKYDLMSDSERAELQFHHPLDAVVGLKLGRSNNSTTGAGLLCFDEFQVADVGDARLMHGILTRLMQSGTIVCFTANRAPADLNRSQLQDNDFRPFLDMIHERCDMMNLAPGRDYRQVLSEADKSTTTLYLPKDASVEELQALWRQQTKCDWDDVVTQVMPVAYGREFFVERAAPRAQAIQLSTTELFDSPVGASDFRALAENCRFIFISDLVPIFTSNTRNLARRFITLIDICYEEKVRIAMRMEADTLDDMFSKVDVSMPDASLAEGLQFESEIAKEGVGASNRKLSMSTLYSGEDEAFAFQRAISRLKEMQTENFHKRRPVFW